MNKFSITLLIVVLVTLFSQARSQATLDVGSDSTNILVDADSTTHYENDEMDEGADTKNISIDADSSHSHEYETSLDNKHSTNEANIVNQTKLETATDAMNVNETYPKMRNMSVSDFPENASFSDNHSSVEEYASTVNQGVEGSLDSNLGKRLLQDNVGNRTVPFHLGETEEHFKPYFDKLSNATRNTNSSERTGSSLFSNDQPLVNTEYYQFGHTHGNDQDFLNINFDQHLLQHQDGIAHTHMDEQPDDHLDMINHQARMYGPNAGNGIVYVPVMYQENDYSNEFVYNPVHPSHRFGYYVPEVYPQYIARMNVHAQPSIRAQPAIPDPSPNSATKSEKRKEVHTQSKYYEQV